MVENYYKENPKFKEKYLKKMEKASNGRNGTSSYGEYGLKEIGTYGSTDKSYELISEGNVIYSNPTKKGEKSHLYKDLSDLFERWYK